MKTKYSTISVEKQKPLNLESNQEIKTPLDDIIEADGLISEVLEKEALDEIISVSMYPDPFESVREALNNALRQCRTAAKLGASPEINIIFDLKFNNLTIEEIDSMGMPSQTFKDVYRHLGRSGNLDGKESGMFGIGKKSFRAISHSLLFETFARETNEKYSFLYKGSKFDPKIKPPIMEKYGARVTFAIKDDIKLPELAKYIKTITKFTKVKTNLVFLDDLYESETAKKLDQEPKFKKGKTQIGLVDPKEFLSEKLGLDNIHWVEIENDNYHLCLAFSEKYVKDHVYLNYLVGIPISLGETISQYDSKEKNEIPNAGCVGYFLNIKNERMFAPVASRESLLSKSFKDLSAVIKADLEKFFSKIKIKTVEDYQNNPNSYFAKNLPSYFVESLPKETVNFNELLKLRLFAFDGTQTEDREYTASLDKVFEKNAQFISSYNKIKTKINKVIEICPDVIVLVPDGSKNYYSYGQNKNDRKQALEIMKNAGISNISDFVKEKNIKMPRNTVLGEVAVRYLGWGENVTQMNLCDLDENCIRIPKEFLADATIKEFAERLRDSELSKYAVFKDHKKFEETESITLEEFMKNTENIQFETTKGTLTANQIIEYEKIDILRAHKSKFAKRLTPQFCMEQSNSDLVIIDDESKTDNIQALILIDEISKVEFHTVEHHYDEFIGKQIVEDIEIEFEGNWSESPENALERLGQIKKGVVREFYAKTYSKIFEYSKGWESEEEADIKICKEIHELFLELANKEYTEFEITLKLFKKFKDADETTWQHTVRNMTKEIICDKFKDRVDRAKTNKEAFELFYKGTAEDLEISIQEDEGKIKLSFVANQKITIDGTFEDILNDVNSGYWRRGNVTIDGNKIEVIYR